MKRKHDEAGQITKYRYLQRQNPVGCSRTVHLPYKLWQKEYQREKRFNKKEKHPVWTSRQLSMLVLYEHPLKKSSITYCQKCPCEESRCQTVVGKEQACWRVVRSKLDIFTPRSAGHPVYLKIDQLENLHARSQKSKKLLYAFFFPKAISKTLKEDTWRIKGL